MAKPYRLRCFSLVKSDGEQVTGQQSNIVIPGAFARWLHIFFLGNNYHFTVFLL